MLAEQLGVGGPQSSTGILGADLNKNDLEKFKEEQIYQLYELLQAAKSNENG